MNDGDGRFILDGSGSPVCSPGCEVGSNIDEDDGGQRPVSISCPSGAGDTILLSRSTVDGITPTEAGGSRVSSKVVGTECGENPADVGSCCSKSRVGLPNLFSSPGWREANGKDASPAFDAAAFEEIVLGTGAWEKSAGTCSMVGANGRVGPGAGGAGEDG